METTKWIPRLAGRTDRRERARPKTNVDDYFKVFLPRAQKPALSLPNGWGFGHALPRRNFVSAAGRRADLCGSPFGRSLRSVRSGRVCRLSTLPPKQSFAGGVHCEPVWEGGANHSL